MIIATSLLAVMQVLVKALPGIPVTQIILSRACISIVLCTSILYSNKVSFKGKNIPLLTIRGLVGTISLITFFYTLQHIPLATAVTIGHLAPLFLGVLAVVFLKERFNKIIWFSFLICFIGVFLIKGFDTRVSTFELLLAIASAFLAALAHFTVRLLKDEHPVVILFYFSLVSIPLLIPYTITNWVQPNNMEWIFLIAVGLISHIAQYYLTKAFKEEKISKLASIYYLGIILAVLMGYFIYQEAFTFESYLGMALLIFGVLLPIVYNKKPSN
jgi:drug/metabolite transporter (DMT)-like permease